jgi:hypothetical protein
MPFTNFLLSVATVGEVSIDSPVQHWRKSTPHISTPRTIATPITRVVRSSFMRKNRRKYKIRASVGARGWRSATSLV